MRSTLWVTVGGVVALLGGFWALQGIGVIGGSSMTGSTTWLVIGVVMLAIGATLILFGVRPSGDRQGRADRE